MSSIRVGVDAARDCRAPCGSRYPVRNLLHRRLLHTLQHRINQEREGCDEVDHAHEQDRGLQAHPVHDIDAGKGADWDAGDKAGTHRAKDTGTHLDW